ncbi:hypothetical protein [Archaeoglobus profundus]|uniref:Uncharacterized protein n=1 Tax=Archaeoglobus profundus (strain DSM 5631 / JCM 9629 / NBRC 100127 / Av18) TaxID=572546 RepID=D2RDK8_ARCPA|nr:hypothetical protein [Archaeoglobus profundus]ADB58202.1 hypothetical protein Arcpr_1146 [Archaeoglobus profundus DSM 5631]
MESEDMKGNRERRGELLRTSIMLTPEHRSKLAILMQVTGADMSEILGSAIDLYYWYVKKYAEKEGLEDIVQLLEVAEKVKSLARRKIDPEKVEEFAKSDILSRTKKK